MRSSACGRMTAADNANATMQHAAREKPTYTNQICTWYMRRTYSSTMYLLRTYQRQEQLAELLLLLVRV